MLSTVPARLAVGVVLIGRDERHFAVRGVRRNAVVLHELAALVGHAVEFHAQAHSAPGQLRGVGVWATHGRDPAVQHQMPHQHEVAADIPPPDRSRKSIPRKHISLSF